MDLWPCPQFILFRFRELEADLRIPSQHGFELLPGCGALSQLNELCEARALFDDSPFMAGMPTLLCSIH